MSMMINNVDYYDREGCCLTCPEAEDGCLCRNMACKICLHYIRPEEYDGEHGRCEITLEAKENKEIVWLDKFSIEQSTEKAVLVHAKPYEDSWFPTSQIKIRRKLIGIPRWLLKEKGWDDDE